MKISLFFRSILPRILLCLQKGKVSLMAPLRERPEPKHRLKLLLWNTEIGSSSHSESSLHKGMFSQIFAARSDLRVKYTVSRALWSTAPRITSHTCMQQESFCTKYFCQGGITITVVKLEQSTAKPPHSLVCWHPKLGCLDNQGLQETAS